MYKNLTSGNNLIENYIEGSELEVCLIVQIQKYLVQKQKI